MAKFDKGRIPAPFDYVRSVLSDMGVNHRTRKTKNGWPYLTFQHPRDETPVSFQFRAKTKKKDARILIFMPGDTPDRQKVFQYSRMSDFLQFLGLSADRIKKLENEQKIRKGNETMDHNGWHYDGDVGIRHGGQYWRIDSDDSDVFQVVRVTPLSDSGGPDNQFRVETGSVDLSLMSDKIPGARETCGFPQDNADKTLDFNAILS